MVAVPDDRGRHRTRMTTTMMITTMQQSNRMRAMRGGGNATAGDAMRGNATTSCSKQDANRTRRRTGEQEAIMGNSGDVSQGRCGGGVPYCGPRGARFNLFLNPLS